MKFTCGSCSNPIVDWSKATRSPSNGQFFCSQQCRGNKWKAKKTKINSTNLIYEPETYEEGLQLLVKERSMIGQTLREIGEALGVTRERARQFVAKFDYHEIRERGKEELKEEEWRAAIAEHKHGSEILRVLDEAKQKGFEVEYDHFRSFLSRASIGGAEVCWHFAVKPVPTNPNVSGTKYYRISWLSPEVLNVVVFPNGKTTFLLPRKKKYSSKMLYFSEKEVETGEFEWPSVEDLRKSLDYLKKDKTFPNKYVKLFFYQGRGGLPEPGKRIDHKALTEAAVKRGRRRVVWARKVDETAFTILDGNGKPTGEKVLTHGRHTEIPAICGEGVGNRINPNMKIAWNSLT